jgi:hypothetical protein
MTCQYGYEHYNIKKKSIVSLTHFITYFLIKLGFDLGDSNRILKYIITRGSRKTYCKEYKRWMGR